MMQDGWVFGYGSLMWRPGFRFVESRPALLRGRHRRLCIYSHVHRGTPERPGLVLGLDRGGSCRGLAFRVAARDWEETVAYLREREQVTSVYLERTSTITLMDGGGGSLPALTYVVDRHHAQYAGALSIADQLKFVRQGVGIGGPCGDYVMSTLDHLRELGLKDRPLEALSRALGPDAREPTVCEC